jgi:hypothetical protein
LWLRAMMAAVLRLVALGAAAVAMLGRAGAAKSAVSAVVNWRLFMGDMWGCCEWFASRLSY